MAGRRMRTPLILIFLAATAAACAHRKTGVPPASAQPSVPAATSSVPMSAADAETQRALLASLRQADALAAAGNDADANEIYLRLATAANAPREIVSGAAVGLYRTGAFADAVAAFRRLGAFGRGEEDLRYYFAVALYETGSFDEARKELSCALPFIELTSDVQRYRTRIERAGVQGRGR